jgi:hypothetical protein
MSYSLIDESQLRHRHEKIVFIASVILNLAIPTFAIALALKGSDWLSAHPFFAEKIKKILVAAIIAILSPLALGFIRNTRREFIRGNSLRLSKDQLPQVYEVFEKHCEKLGMKNIPELYLSEGAISDYSMACSAWGRNFIVLGTTLLDPEIGDRRPVIGFALGRELGALRLGYTKWWDEFLLSYVNMLPFLKNPLCRMRTYSCDRYGAYLTPDGLSGLIVLSAGPFMLKHVNVSEYVKKVHEYGGFWVKLSESSKRTPHISNRIKALFDAGLFRLEQNILRLVEDEKKVKGWRF